MEPDWASAIIPFPARQGRLAESQWQLFVRNADRYSITKLLLRQNLAFSLTVKLLHTPRLW